MTKLLKFELLPNCGWRAAREPICDEGPGGRILVFIDARTDPDEVRRALGGLAHEFAAERLRRERTTRIAAAVRDYLKSGRRRK